MALPSSYQEVEYLIDSGNAYIDTGVLTAGDLEVYCKFLVKAQSTLIFGGRKSAGESSLTFGFVSDNGNSVFSGFGGSTASKAITVNIFDSKSHEVILSNSKYTIDGTDQTISRGTFSSYYSMFLGTWSNAGSADSRHFNGYIYAFHIKKNGTLIMNLVPCYRVSDNKTGFYDLIGNTFYASKTSSDFGKGADIKTTVTYKTVIHNAIKGFNDIQNTLSNLSSDFTFTTVSSSSTASICTVEELNSAVKKLATIKTSSGFVKGKVPVYDPTTDGGTK